MASSIYSLWKVNIENLVVNKVHICRNFHIQPSEIERLAWWEYEYMLKEMNETSENENKQNEEASSKYNADKYMGNAMHSAKDMMSGVSSSMPHMPSMPSIPKI